MTSTEIAIRGNLDLGVLEPLAKFAAQIAQTEFVPTKLRNRPEAVLACFVTGQELGIPPMQSLRQIDVIDGNVAQRSELMRAMVLADGHEFWFGEGAEFSMTRVVAYGRRKGENTVGRVEWTLDQARTANLAGKKNWKENPRAMLTARATAELCRTKFPDIIAGARTAEEMNDGDMIDDRDVVDAEIVEESKNTTTRTAPAPRKRATAPPKPKAQPAEVAPAPRPPLPGEQTTEVAEDQQTEAQKARSVAIVRLAKAIKIDHHPVVAAVTNNETESARMLDEEQAAKVISTLRDIEAGRAEVADRGDGKFAIYAIEDLEGAFDTGKVGSERLDENNQETFEPDADEEIIDAETVDEDDDDDNNPENWDSDQWREYLASKNVKPLALLKQAARTTAQDKIPIGNLQSISGSGKAAELKAFVDAQQP